MICKGAFLLAAAGLLDGRRIGLTIAKDLVVFVRRSGGQTQFSGALAAQTRLRPAGGLQEPFRDAGRPSCRPS